MKDLFKTTTLLLIMAAIFAGCNKQPSNAYNETAEKEKFCSLVTVENIDKTIPIVNEFLSRLSAGLDDEQQLQILVTWLQSCSCIVDAAVLSQPGNETLPVSEILISFDENGIRKELIMDVSMEKPLKVTGYREYEDPMEDEFCLYLNEENIEQTIPIVNGFLCDLNTKFENERRLQEFTYWLQSQPCIMDAGIFNKTNQMSEILISFVENEKIQYLIMEVSMGNILKVIGYRKIDYSIWKCTEYIDRFVIQLTFFPSDNKIHVKTTTDAFLSYRFWGNYITEYLIEEDIMHWGNEDGSFYWRWRLSYISEDEMTIIDKMPSGDSAPMIKRFHFIRQSN